MRWILRLLVAGLVLTGSVFSQEKKPDPKPETVPVVSQQDLQTLMQLQGISTGITVSIGALQEKLDSINAERSRQLARIQAQHPDYELTPQLVFVKKKTDD